MASIGSPAGAHDIHTLVAEGVHRVEPPASAPVAELAAAVAGFGAKLARQQGVGGANWVVSPLSIAYAFAIARVGAGGETAAEIDRVFGLPAAGRDAAFNAATCQLATVDIPPPRSERREVEGPRPPVVSLSNGLFPRAGLPIGDDFLAALATHYGAGVHPVDFGAGSAEETINSWVRRQTAGRIRSLFAQLPMDTTLVLANTVYLRADWTHRFGLMPTVDAPFTRADGAAVPVPTMRQRADLRHAKGDGWQAVELPYAQSDLAMWVIVPTRNAAPTPLLEPATLGAVAGALRPAFVDLSLPKWDFATAIGLTSALPALGVRAAFGPDADFSGISPGLYIGQAAHQANITVDEWGTEAAAATGIAMVTSARIEPVPVVVRADHPFAFAVVHRGTGMPVFTGVVADPAA